MSIPQNSSPLPENLQELLSTLLKLNSENPGSAVIKVGNELLTLNISKIQEPKTSNNHDIANNREGFCEIKRNFNEESENTNKNFENFSHCEENDQNNQKKDENYGNNIELIDKNSKNIEENSPIYNKDSNDFDISNNENALNMKKFISNVTFHCSNDSPRSLSNEKSGNQFTTDFNTLEVGNLQNERKNSDKNEIFEQNSENNNNFSLSFHQNDELKPQNSLGRLSLLPKMENSDNFIEKNEENSLKINDNCDNRKEEMKSALDFINFFQQKQEKKENTQQENPIKPENKTNDTPKKHFSTSFLNEMKNIPISDNNKINPYAYVNVFSATKSKSPGNDPTSAKLIENIDIKSPDFIKKNSNESENQSKNNFQSPKKAKKQNSNNNNYNNALGMGMNNNNSNNTTNNNSNMNAININNTNNLNNKNVAGMQGTNKQNIAQNANIIKKKVNTFMKPNALMRKTGVTNKERAMFKASSSTIKEVNEEIHSNDDQSKKSKEKISVSKHKTSAQFYEKNPQDEENTEKDINNLTNIATSTIVNTNANNIKSNNSSAFLSNFEEKKFVNQIKMEIPELEMEENLRFLMEKADRSDEMGEKMFQAINSLLKYKQQLETKEKSLKEKEKIFVEFEQKSKSSTQWSYDTKSTLNGVDPIKNLLEEFYKDSSQEGLLYEPPSEADIHFLFLYSSPLITFFRDKEGIIGKRPIFNEIDINNEVKTLQEILPESKREIKFMKSPASLEKIGVIFDRNPRAIHFCGHGVKNNEENFGLVANEEVGDFLVFEDQFGGADFVSCMTLSKLLNKLKNKLHFAFVASCHSKLVGEVFLNAGALHVICVKREERILDKACQIFTKGSFFLEIIIFYHYLYISIQFFFYFIDIQ